LLLSLEKKKKLPSFSPNIKNNRLQDLQWMVIINPMDGMTFMKSLLGGGPLAGHTIFAAKTRIA
jgi:hypothetical protein